MKYIVKNYSDRILLARLCIYNVYTTIIEAPFFREWMWSSGLGRWT